MSQPIDTEPPEEPSSFDDDSLLRKIAHIPEAEAAPAVPASSEVLGEPFPRQELPRVGSIIDQHYRIESVLGEGGMGVVYAARNLRTGREVALKRMIGRERFADGQAGARAERFVREARAVGRIQHPNVVDVYDVGGDVHAPYLVMERLYGRTLGALLARGPLPENEAVELVLSAARGVAAAHREGVIHRDLKPDNIFLSDTPSGPVPKVLDFGVSRITTSESLDSLTRSGTILGTPAYMPYEQLRGGPEVDARADVYALGVILYEALSGRRPFEANNLHDLVLRMAHEEPTPLAEAQPASRAHVRWVVAHCLLREPERRYPDAGALVEALERVLAEPDKNEELLAVPAVTKRPWRRTLLLLAIVLVLALASWTVRDQLARETATLAKPAALPQPVEVTASKREELPVVAPPEAAPTPPAIEPSATPSPKPTASTRKPRHERPTQAEPSQTKLERARELRPSDF